MKAMFQMLWVPVIVFLSILLSNAPAEASARPVAPCTCADVIDLINELNQANEVLDALDEFEARIVRPAVGMNLLTPGAATALDLALKGAISRVRSTDPKTRTGSGDTDSVSCKAKVEAPTDCLKLVIGLRESVNERYCTIAKSREKFKDNDRRNSWPMQTYIEEHRQAYFAEIAEIQRILNTLPSACLPGTWFGTVVVHELLAQKTVITSPNGAVETTDDHTTRRGTIWLDGYPKSNSSSWEVGGKYSNTKVSSGTIYCKGGLAGASELKSLLTSSAIEINKSGGGPRSVEVSVGEPEEDGKIAVHFRIPDIDARGDGQTKSFRKSGCPNDDVDETKPMIAPNYKLNSEPVPGKGTYSKGDKAGPEKITGHEKMELISYKNDRLTMTHTIQVWYKLYKLNLKK
jgi:hypothetical protein